MIFIIKLFELLYTIIIFYKIPKNAYFRDIITVLFNTNLITTIFNSYYNKKY